MDVVYVPLHCVTILQFNCKVSDHWVFITVMGNHLRPLVKLHAYTGSSGKKLCVLGVTVICHLLLIVLAGNTGRNIFPKEAQLSSETVKAWRGVLYVN